MRYELKVSGGQLKPRASLALENLGNIDLHHTTHGLRHPLGIFNLTFGEIVAKSTVLLDKLDDACQKLPYLDPKATSWDQELLDATDHLLDAIMQHLDGFRSVICCFYEDCGSKPAQKVLRALGQDIRDYRDHVAKIVNAIKHKQCRLSTFFFHDIGIFVPGYFVEGVLRDGAVGPDPDIHRGANVAISYNRDLPFHFCNLFYTGAFLAQHIYSITGVSPTKQSKSDDALEEVLKRIAARPMMFFPDELKKPTPLVRYIPGKRNDAATILLEMPSKRFKPRTVPPGCRAQTSWKGDGVSRTFKVPYFGNDAPN